MGILDSLKNFLNTEEKVSKNSDFDKVLNEIISEAIHVHDQNWWYNISLGNLTSYQALKSKPNSIKKEYIRYLCDEINRLTKINNRKRSWDTNDKDRLKQTAYSEIMNSLMRSKLDYSSTELITLFNFYKDSDSSNLKGFSNWPIGFTVQQIEKTIKTSGLDNYLKAFIKEMLNWSEFKQQKNYWGSDLEKARVKLEKIVFESENKEGKISPYKLTEDRFGIMVNTEIDGLKSDEKDLWYELFHLFMKASSSKPSQKYLKTTSAIIDKLGSNKYKTRIRPWLEFVYSLKEIETTHHQTYDGIDYQYSTYEFLHEKSSVFLKGLLWSLVKFHDSKTLNLIGKLAERCFKKIPGVGPAAAGVGNACLYVLGNTKGLEGVSHLSRLKLKIKQNSTRKLIENYISTSSEKLGVSSSEIEELSIPDFGLCNGEKQIVFDDYILKLKIIELGKIQLSWIKPDGSSQKSTPSFVKETAKHKEKLKKAKADVIQIKKYLTAQRDRIDRLYLDDRIWSYDAYQKSYFNHGLVSFITKKLLWQFSDEKRFITALFKEDGWYDKNDKKLDWIDHNTEVRLWHPIYSDIDDVLHWRSIFDVLQIKQPLKQVYREVYILTDAEVNTKSYSNRMAAHILKQHQFNALTAVRGWKYTLMGAFDNGVDAEMATINIRSHGLQAQFWINEILSDDDFNDSGIWNYVATDQVRFTKDDGEAMDLINIPKLVFSEVMRDVDLFVGVCSVGNDPEWRDNGGLPQYRDYWTGYSFGDLTEVAKTRKVILEKILPRLKINDVSTIDGKFLKVKGKKRTYKIHIGSSNILMEPNDQYLCIVPTRGKDKATENVFLPFEGDRGLSLILSKAFLLASDDKIEDPTILSQINR